MKESHESYGMIQLTRISGSPSPLFGSSIKHSNTIRLRVKEAELDRHLNRNWYYGRKDIVEIEMSYSQFVDAISNMSTEGVPCTILYVNGERREPCPFQDVRETFVDEFQKDIDDLLKKSATAAKLAEEKLKASGPISKKERLEIASILYKIEQDLRSNLNFVLSSFNKQTEATVKEAKGEIESFFSSKIHSLGSKALVDSLEKGLLLPPDIEDI